MRDRDRGVLPGLPPPAVLIIEDYLERIVERMPTSRRMKRQIVSEIGDGLACAVAEYVADGTSPAEAARIAVAESGDPELLAGLFARQLGVAAARRTGAALVATGPVVGLAWAISYGGLGHLAIGISAALSVASIYPLILAVVVPAAVIAMCGWRGWGRHLALRPRLVTNAAIVAACGTVFGDIGLMVSTASSGVRVPLPAALFVGFAVSGVRASLAARATWRMARLDAASC